MALIERAIDKKMVLDAFLFGMQPSSWSGSRAENMRKKIPLIEVLQTHPDEAVSIWARDALAKFSEFVERERESEERRDRERDERFEW